MIVRRIPFPQPTESGTHVGLIHHHPGLLPSPADMVLGFVTHTLILLWSAQVFHYNMRKGSVGFSVGGQDEMQPYQSISVITHVPQGD